MARPDLRQREAWRVRIPAHTIQARSLSGDPIRGKVYEIPEVVATRFEEARETAIRFAVTWAHADAGVPPWLPYVRESIALARAQRTVVTAGE